SSAGLDRRASAPSRTADRRLVGAAGRGGGAGAGTRLVGAGRSRRPPRHHPPGDERPPQGRRLRRHRGRARRLRGLRLGPEGRGMTETFAALLLAHVLADFVLQTDWIAQNKSSRNIGALLLHGLTVGATAALTTGSLV